MSRLGPYTLLRRIAVGGMAEIFLARREGPAGFAKIVALKKILPHLSSVSDFVDMFLDEARIAARLSHPNIVQIYDFGEFDDSFFIAMEYVPGEDLLAVIRQARDRGRPVPPVMAAVILSSACEALHYAHELKNEQGRPLGIVHRDVTPSNLLVSFDGIVKLADFGIAKAERKVSHTVAGALKGKYAYMSPEQVLGLAVDPRSDVFSLGVVAYELLTGQRLFHRESELAILAAVTKDPIPSIQEKRPELPDDLKEIVDRALDREAVRRWHTAQEMQLALEEFCIQHASLGARFQLAQYMKDLFGGDHVRLRERLAAGDFDEGENTAMLPPPAAPNGGAAPPIDRDDPTELQPMDLSPDGILVGEAHEAPDKAAPIRPSGGRGTWIVASMLGLAAAAGVVWSLNQGGQTGEAATTPVPAERLAEPADARASAGLADDAERASVRDAEEGEPDDTTPDAALRPSSIEAAPLILVPKDRKKKDREKEKEREKERDRKHERERKKEEAFLTIDVTPWAEVLVDGESVGTTPIARRKIEAGRHVVTLIGRDEGNRVRFPFTVKSGEEHVEKRILQTGKLACDAEPWAEVYIGNRRLGTTPLAPVTLTEGTYTLRLFNPELNKEKNVTARVRAGQVTRLKEKL